MMRRDCIAWLERNDYPIPPKSGIGGEMFLHCSAMAHDNMLGTHLEGDRATFATAGETELANYVTGLWRTRPTRAGLRRAVKRVGRELDANEKT